MKYEFDKRRAIYIVLVIALFLTINPIHWVYATEEYVGIGVELLRVRFFNELNHGTTLFEETNGYVEVVGVIPKSPAEIVGLMGGYRIIKIDGKAVNTMTDKEVMDALRGLEGTGVTLYGYRPLERYEGGWAFGKEKVFTITRQKITID